MRSLHRKAYLGNLPLLRLRLEGRRLWTRVHRLVFLGHLTMLAKHLWQFGHHRIGLHSKLQLRRSDGLFRLRDEM